MAHCPGRFVLSMNEFDGSPETLAGSQVATASFQSEHAADPVAVVTLEGGGLISYRKPDGRYLHTLNSPQGFARKLKQLGIILPPTGHMRGEPLKPRRPPSDTIQRMTHSERFLKIVDQAKALIEETSVEEVRRDLDAGADFALVDTREESEWAAGHAQGAIHLGKGVIERDVEAAIPDTAKKIVLYCGGGYRSALAAEALQKMGYGNVYSLAGGWRAWKSGEMPIEKPLES